MKRRNKLLVALSAALALSMPVFAEGKALGADFGGLETLAMALVLVVAVFFLQKFNK